MITLKQRVKTENTILESYVKEIKTEAGSIVAGMISRAVYRSAKEAISALLPVDERAFSNNFAYRRRLTSRASSKWNVGYASGKSLSKLIRNMDSANESVSISKSGNITFRYEIPIDVSENLVSESDKIYRNLAIKGRSYSGRNKAIQGLYRWMVAKRVIFKQVEAKDRYLRQAFIVYNSWSSEKGKLRKRFHSGKPRIMNENALKISRNKEAINLYNHNLSMEFDKIKSSLGSEISKKIFKK